MLMRNGCSGFAGDGADTDATLVTAVLSADPCKTWNAIFTFVLGNRNVHLQTKHVQNMLTFVVKFRYPNAQKRPLT